jgi:hypothetical protein
MIHANQFAKTAQQLHLHHITSSMPAGNSFPTYSYPPLQTATMKCLHWSGWVGCAVVPRWYTWIILSMRAMNSFLTYTLLSLWIATVQYLCAPGWFDCAGLPEWFAQIISSIRVVKNFLPTQVTTVNYHHKVSTCTRMSWHHYVSCLDKIHNNERDQRF